MSTSILDAHEAFSEFLFQRFQRFLDQVLAARVVHHHVLLLGLEVMHGAHRDQPQRAAHARAGRRGGGAAWTG